jgi:GNAT superfamily N-acetyltransferase
MHTPPDPSTGYTVSTDPSLLDFEMIYDYLSHRSYWAQGRPREMQEQAMRNSLCFGVYASDGRQAGFCRVVTDYATFAWLCDVFVLESERGKGLGKLLVQAVVDEPKLQGLRNFILATRDAHALYQRYGGFNRLNKPDHWMERRPVP